MSQYTHESNNKYEIVEFWGPYIYWGERPDVIIFGKINTPRGSQTPKDSPNYPIFLLEREGYESHIAEKGKSCKRDPCYTRALELANGGEVLVLNKTK